LLFVVPKTRRNPVLFFLRERIGERKKEWTLEGDVAGENKRALGEMNAGREGDVAGGNEEGFEELAMQFS
jgi:hypothetical protein